LEGKPPLRNGVAKWPSVASKSTIFAGPSSAAVAYKVKVVRGDLYKYSFSVSAMS
jgi:hypothetical protein